MNQPIEYHHYYAVIYITIGVVIGFFLRKFDDNIDPTILMTFILFWPIFLFVLILLMPFYIIGEGLNEIYDWIIDRLPW